MATEVTPRAILEDRWKVATLAGAPRRYANTNGIDAYMTKRWHRIQESMEELAAILVDGFHELEYDEDPDSLMAATDRVWKFMEAELVGWAEREPERGVRIRAVLQARHAESNKPQLIA